MNIQDINIEDLCVSDINVRKTQINEISDLANSISINGLINPITVQLINGKYEIIAGQRRYLAMKELHKKTIPCNVITTTNGQAEEISLIENIQKNTLSNCDKVRSYSKLYDNYANDFDKIKTMVKISKSTLKKYQKIKDLPVEILEKLDAPDKTKITVDIAIELTTIIDNGLDIIELIDKMAPLKAKNKIEVIKKIKENNVINIDELDDIIEDISENNTDSKNYKGPFVFDSVKQQNILIPENMYAELVEMIKLKQGEEIIYF
jgi:ParB family chromosome partitioning protein